MLKKILALLSFSAILFGMIYLFEYQYTHAQHTVESEVHNFETCVEAQGTIMDVSPRQCTYDHTNYTEIIENDVELIGGQRDDHGCLGPAGYTYDAVVNACLRNWEFDEEQKGIATIAAQEFSGEYALTILSVISSETENMYVVELSYGENGTMKNLTIENGEISLISDI